MSSGLRGLVVLVLTLAVSIGVGQAPPASHSTPSPVDSVKLELAALAALQPADTHTHVAKADASFYAMLDRLHMHLVDILVVDDQDAYRKDLNIQRQDAEAMIGASHRQAVLCTSFDPFQLNRADFPAVAIRHLNQDFARGAVAVKIWKNIGMELKDPSGHYVLADDPAFEPIYQDIESHNRTLIAHQAEPDAAWQSPNPNGLDYSYYQQNPVWNMYTKPEAPKKQEILNARDRLLAENPQLRVVGAHLGSMEDDLGALGKRLDRYPNFAVDTAARVVHLVVMPSDRVRNFILQYQDRIVYGTDLEFAKPASADETVKQWEEHYARDWHYFSTGDTFDYAGHRTQGLALPPAVLQKLYHANAARWFPGMF
jgi:predicted TIM-barrel fold metal-dependent hydrolase